MSVLVYHATAGDFDHLDHDRSGLGTHFGTREAALDRAAMRGHGGHKLHRHLKDGWRIKSYRLHVAHPLVARDISGWDDLPNVEFELRRLGILDNEAYKYCRWNLDGAAAWAFLRRKIEASGYDCVTYRNELEDVGSMSYIVWNDDLIGSDE